MWRRGFSKDAEIRILVALKGPGFEAPSLSFPPLALTLAFLSRRDEEALKIEAKKEQTWPMKFCEFLSYPLLLGSFSFLSSSKSASVYQKENLPFFPLPPHPQFLFASFLHLSLPFSLFLSLLVFKMALRNGYFYKKNGFEVMEGCSVSSFSGFIAIRQLPSLIWPKRRAQDLNFFWKIIFLAEKIRISRTLTWSWYAWY